MKLPKILFGLQLFAEGASDGGAAAQGGESGTAEAAGAENMPQGIPERAKKYYEAALKKTAARKVDTAEPKQSDNAKADAVNTGNSEAGESGITETKKPTYRELIESDDYKEEHERYIQKAIRDRMKKHEAEESATNELLTLVGQKYGLDVKSATFREDLSNAIKADDSTYQKYADEHDIPVQEAKKIFGLQQQLDSAKREADARRIADENERVINALRAKGEETKKLYPDFDLDTLMQDSRFGRLAVAFNGDTTMAYEALNHRVLQRKAVEDAEKKAAQAVANSVKANQSRPSEGRISPGSDTQTMPDFRSMGLDALRKWASQQKHLSGSE